MRLLCLAIVQNIDQVQTGNHPAPGRQLPFGFKPPTSLNPSHQRQRVSGAKVAKIPLPLPLFQIVNCAFFKSTRLTSHVTTKTRPWNTSLPLITRQAISSWFSPVNYRW